MNNQISQVAAGAAGVSGAGTASSGARRDMSAEVSEFLAAARKAEERYKKYSRVADMLDRLALALYIPAFAVTAVGLAVGLVAYLLYSMPHLVIAGLSLWIAGYAAYILHNVYSHEAAKAARQACVFRRTAETLDEIKKVMAELEKDVEKLEQEMKKRGIGVS